MIDLNNCKTMNAIHDIRVAKALIYNPNNEILILLRGDSHPVFAGHFDFPGGIIEDGEDPDSAMFREIFEEIGYVADESKPSRVFSTTYEANNNTHYIYKLELKSEITINLSWEHKGFLWLSENELLTSEIPNHVDSYYLTVIRYLQNK